MSYTLAELKKDVAAGGIDTVLVAFPDMQGRMIGKRFQAEYFLEVANDETHGCDYLLADDIDMEPVPGYAAANWGKGYGDFVMKPDLATLMKATWLEGTAIVLCDLSDHHHHAPIPHSPRAILKGQIERLAAMGYTANAATELEFYLFDEDYRTISEKGHANARTAGAYIQDYHIFQTTKEEGVMRALRRHLQASGIPVESSKGEWGPGQEEINIKYADALTMADRHVVLKNATKEIAWAAGKAVTFMAKWDYTLAGSSSHIHMSLADKAGKSAFVDTSDERGMSPVMKHFMAGQLAHAREITYFLAPYINSYKRFQAGTFAPTKAIWSPDNRTAGFRLCGEHSKSIRVECRMGGADLNPYLAIAALLAAGIKGIEDRLELEPAFVGDAYTTKKLREIPKTLREATQTMRKSKMLKAAFGEGVIDHYVHTAEWEQFEYDRRVTDWELQRGFERS
ncbi:glutamine synthetase family protein [Devosia sp. Root635]|uniref:glutamine synthetase family protein n=1 Tax=Devosia sp. Root635 TaxID=1736575 RepID=UPI0006F7B03A|nr:glutamine synthetase family protein [Devosia sp. Root635]KRA42209.1 glutamine synthetase [Devosia sp. Root635]